MTSLSAIKKTADSPWEGGATVGVGILRTKIKYDIVTCLSALISNLSLFRVVL